MEFPPPPVGQHDSTPASTPSPPPKFPLLSLILSTTFALTTGLLTDWTTAATVFVALLGLFTKPG